MADTGFVPPRPDEWQGPASTGGFVPPRPDEWQGPANAQASTTQAQTPGWWSQAGHNLWNAVTGPVKQAVTGHAIEAMGGSTVGKEYDRAIDALSDYSARAANKVFGRGTSAQLSKDFGTQADILRGVGKIPATLIDAAFFTPLGAATSALLPGVGAGTVSPPVNAAVGAGFGAQMTTGAAQAVQKAREEPTSENIREAATAVGSAALPIVHAVGGARATISPGVSDLFKDSKKVLAVRAYKPGAADSKFVDTIEPTVANVQAGMPFAKGATRRPVETNEHAITGARARINELQDNGLGAWHEAAKQRGDQVPLASLAQGARESIPILDQLEDRPAAEELKQKMQDVYGKTTMNVDRAREFLKQLNATLDSFYDKSTGKRQSTETAGVAAEARIKALRDNLANAYYETLDPQGKGAGPREIQHQTGNLINFLDLSHQARNAIIGEQPIQRADALANTLFSIADLPGKALHGDLEGGVGNVLRGGGSKRDAYIKRLFKNPGEAPAIPMPPGAEPTAPPPGSGTPPSGPTAAGPASAAGPTTPPPFDPEAALAKTKQMVAERDAIAQKWTGKPYGDLTDDYDRMLVRNEQSPPPETEARDRRTFADWPERQNVPKTGPPPRALRPSPPAEIGPIPEGGAREAALQRNTPAAEEPPPPAAPAAAEAPPADEALYQQAVAHIRQLGKASTSTLQRNFRMGYGAAAKMLDRMEKEGIVGPADGSKPREVLPPRPNEPAVAPAEAEPERTIQNVDWKDSRGVNSELNASLAEGSTRLHPKGGIEKLENVPLNKIDPEEGNKLYPEKVATYMEKPSPYAPELRIQPEGRFRSYEGHHRIAAMKAQEMGLTAEDVRGMPRDVPRDHPDWETTPSKALGDKLAAAPPPKGSTLAWTSEGDEFNYPKAPSGADARAAGELAANPPEPPTAAEAGQPAYPTGNTTSVMTPRGTNMDVQYAVVDASQPVVSHDLAGNENPAYPAERQPRDRTRVASQAQIENIAQTLNPIRVASDYRATDGAPIVDPNLIVEAGNGRINGIKQAYAKYPEKAEAYRQFLLKEAANFGLKPEDIAGVKQPVLVRVRKSAVDPAQFAAEANEPWTASMSASEQARSDAQRMSPKTLGMLTPSESGEIMHAGNRDFVRSFMDQVISPAERSRYQQADGSISQEGVARIRNAIFARAYGETGTLEKLAESTDSNIKNITNGMLGAAPRFVDLQSGIKVGTLHPGLDLAPDVSAAVNKLSALRERGTTVSDYLNQIAMFDDGVSPEARDILGVFDKYSKAPRKIGRILESYADGVESAGDPRQEGMFGTMKPPTKGEILEAAVKRTEKEFADERSAKERPAKANPLEAVRQEQAGNGEKGPGANGSEKVVSPTGFQAQLGPTSQRPPVGDLFGEESSKISETQAAAEAKGKAQLAGDQLTAEFNSPVNAGNRRTKLKPGAKPVQESMFGPTAEPPPQGGFDFQSEIAAKKLKQDFSKRFQSADPNGSIERSVHRIYPQTATMAARFYIDETGKAIFNGAIEAVDKEKASISGLYLDKVDGQRISDVLRAGPKTKKFSDTAQAKLTAMADSLDKALADNPKGVSVVDATTGKSLADIKGTVRHEAAHGEQVSLAGLGKKPLFDYKKAINDIPNFFSVTRELGKRGYSQTNLQSMMREILSTASERTYDKTTGKNAIGLNKDQMADTVAAIVEKAVAVHGEKAYNLINQMAPEFKAEVMAKVKAKASNAK